MNKKIFLSLGIAGILTCSFNAIPANAVSYDDTTAYTDEVEPRAEELISLYYLSVSKNNNSLSINAKIKCRTTMKSVGLKDIQIQRSSDNKNWSTEKSLDDMLVSSTDNYSISNYNVSVQGGYYYRVKCTHYAKEDKLFGSSQSKSNTSNSVWIG